MRPPSGPGFPAGLREEGAGGEWPGRPAEVPGRAPTAAGLPHRAMAWAPSVAGWLGGFLLVPGEVGGQGTRAGKLAGLGIRRRGVPKSRPLGAPKGRFPCAGREPLAMVGCTHTRGDALPLARSWVDPLPPRQLVPGCLDGKLKRDAGTVVDSVLAP